MDSYGYDCYFEADTGEAEEGTDYYHAPTQHNYNPRPDSEWGGYTAEQVVCGLH